MVAHVVVSYQVAERLRAIETGERTAIVDSLQHELNPDGPHTVELPGAKGYLQQSILGYAITYRRLSLKELDDLDADTDEGYEVVGLVTLAEKIMRALG